jgi:probable HAF family extracellular repeat protein
MNTPTNQRWWPQAILMASIACTAAANAATGSTEPAQVQRAFPNALRILNTATVNGLTITLQQLPDFPGAAASDAYSINNAGDIVGGAVVAPTWNEHPLMWPKAGAPIDLGLPLGIPYGSARFITDLGYIAGATAYEQTALGTPIVYRPGAPVALPTLAPAGVAFAWSINNRGEAAGSARNYTYPRRFEAGVRWVNGQIQDLGLAPGMVYTNAYGINDTGDVVGTTGDAYLIGNTHAFVWRNGGFTLLPSLGGSGANNIATFIHNNGDIVGASRDVSGATHAALWRNGQITDLGATSPIPGGQLTAALAVNSHGMAVGYGTGTGTQLATLFAGGQVITLPQPPLATPAMSVAYSINDVGQIVGSGYVDSTFLRKPLLWTVSGTPGGNRAPLAIITSAGQGFESLPIAFSGRSSIDPDGDALTYKWSFGDGTTGTGVSPSHIYADNGTYIASLTVTDPSGLSGTGSMTINVFNAQPSISIAATTSKSIRAGGSVSMRATIGDPGKLDAPWTIVTDWGNGQTTTSRAKLGSFNLSQRYNNAGTYTVRATVTDKDGLTGYSNEFVVTVR